jgi:hypothetical protein
LPDQSVGIFGGVCFPCVKATDPSQQIAPSGGETCCKKNDGFFWNNIEYIKDLYYRPHPNTKLALEGDKTNFMAYSYSVDLNRLDLLIEEAIEYLDI